jgi:hypothetical protein
MQNNPNQNQNNSNEGQTNQPKSVEKMQAPSWANMTTQKVIKEEREGIRDNYNPEETQPTPEKKVNLLTGLRGIWEAASQKPLIEGVEDIVSIVKSPFVKKTKEAGQQSNTKEQKKAVANIPAEAVDPNPSLAEIMESDKFKANLPPEWNVAKPAAKTNQPTQGNGKAKMEITRAPEKIANPAQINQDLDSVIDKAKAYSLQTMDILDTLNTLDSEIDILGKECEEIKSQISKSTSFDIASGKIMLNTNTDLKQKLTEKQNKLDSLEFDRNEIEKINEEIEEEIMSGLEDVANNFRALFNSKEDINSKFIIEQELVPKMRSIGFEIKQEYGRWDIVDSNFPKVISSFSSKANINQLENNSVKQTDANEEDVTQSQNEKPASVSFKFPINDPRLVVSNIPTTKEQKLKNISDILSDDYNELAKHFNNQDQSDSTESDLANLKKRIQYTADKLASWTTDKVKNPKYKNDTDTPGIEKFVQANATKDEALTKLKAIGIIANLAKYGINIDQGSNPSTYETKTNSRLASGYGESMSGISSVSTISAPVMSPAIEQSAAPKVKSRMEIFEEGTKRYSQPKTQQEAAILQDEINKNLSRIVNKGTRYIIGSNINGEMKYKEVTESDFANSNPGKIKLSMPIPYTGDTSPGANAANNIYNQLNARELRSSSDDMFISENPFADVSENYLGEGDSKPAYFDDIPLPDPSRSSTFYEHLGDTTLLNSDEIALPNQDNNTIGYEHLDGLDATPIDLNAVAEPIKDGENGFVDRRKLSK